MLYLSELHAEFVDEYGADPEEPGRDEDEAREGADAVGRRQLTTVRVRRRRMRVGERLSYIPSRPA